MHDYTVFFEIYNKKMKTTVIAANKNAAENMVRNSLNIIKVEESEFNVVNELFKHFK